MNKTRGKTMLLQLVENRTLDEHVAALLWTIVEEKRGLVTAAVPRKAGKTTVLHAALEFAPAGTPVHHLDGTLEQIQRLGKKPDGGYLVVGEISTEPPPRYIWGEKVRALFATLDAGFSLATTMHATGPEDVFQQICVGNEIGDRDASRLQYVVYVERSGDSDDTYTRRVRGVYEIAGVKKGVPQARPLHLWSDGRGRLEQAGVPKLLATSEAALIQRARGIRALVKASRTSRQDVGQLRSSSPAAVRSRGTQGGGR